MLSETFTLTTTHDISDDATNKRVNMELSMLGFKVECTGMEWDDVAEQAIYHLALTAPTTNTNWVAAAEYLNGTMIG